MVFFSPSHLASLTYAYWISSQKLGETNLWILYLSACVESVQTTLAALLPVRRLPRRRSKPFTLLLSRNSSWMEVGWMTGWLRLSSSSGTDSTLSSRFRITDEACWDCVMVIGGWELPSLKWLCSNELTYSTTLKWDGRGFRLCGKICEICLLSFKFRL